MLRAKGTRSHMLFGWVWIGLMAATAGTSFFIHDIRSFGLFSYILTQLSTKQSVSDFMVLKTI